MDFAQFGGHSVGSDAIKLPQFQAILFPLQLDGDRTHASYSVGRSTAARASQTFLQSVNHRSARR